MKDFKISEFLEFLKEKGWGSYKCRTLEKLFYEFVVTKNFEAIPKNVGTTTNK
jgi:hypothetical protein